MSERDTAACSLQNEYASGRVVPCRRQPAFVLSQVGPPLAVACRQHLARLVDLLYARIDAASMGGGVRDVQPRLPLVVEPYYPNRSRGESAPDNVVAFRRPNAT